MVAQAERMLAETRANIATKEQEVEERLEDILEERKLQSEITQYIKELSFPDICEHEYADEDLEDFQNQVEKHFEEQGFEKCP